MLYQKPSQWNRIRRLRGFHRLADFLAGVHAAHGLAHGVQPPRNSIARQVKWAGPA